MTTDLTHVLQLNILQLTSAVICTDHIQVRGSKQRDLRNRNRIIESKYDRPIDAQPIPHIAWFDLHALTKNFHVPRGFRLEEHICICAVRRDSYLIILASSQVILIKYFSQYIYNYISCLLNLYIGSCSCQVQLSITHIYISALSQAGRPPTESGGLLLPYKPYAWRSAVVDYNIHDMGNFLETIVNI